MKSESPSHNPPYAVLANKLRQRISDEKLVAGDFVGTELQLVKELNRSRMTVRRAISLLINEGLIERKPGRGVFVREHGHTTHQIQMLAGNLMWTPAVRVSRAVQESALQTGADVRLYDAMGSIDNDVKTILALPETGAAGAILMSQHCPAFNRALSMLVAKNFPFVVVDQELNEIAAPYVVSDNLQGGRLCGEELISLGHTHIGFIGDLNATTSARRYAGVDEACRAASLPAPQQFDILVNDRFDDWMPNIHNEIAKLLALPSRPTALVCSCDAVARHVCRELEAAGLKVPRDVSVIGFDDDPIAEWCSPALTTIRQDFDSMGRAAYEQLERLISHPTEPLSHALLPVTLIRRESVAPPPAK